MCPPLQTVLAVIPKNIISQLIVNISNFGIGDVFKLKKEINEVFKFRYLDAWLDFFHDTMHKGKRCFSYKN